MHARMLRACSATKGRCSRGKRARRVRFISLLTHTVRAHSDKELMKPLAAASEARTADGKPPAKAAAAGAPRAGSAVEPAKGAAAGGSDTLAKVSMKKLFGRPNIKKDGTPGKVRGARHMQIHLGGQAENTDQHRSLLPAWAGAAGVHAVHSFIMHWGS